jgi:ureidoacrylate peracid hydrolase
VHKITLPAWSIEAGSRAAALERLDMARTALIVVDMQNFFLTSTGLNIEAARDIIPAVNELAAATREAGGTVVFLRHTYVASGRGDLPGRQLPDDFRQVFAAGLSEGTPGNALHPDLDVEEKDIIVKKIRPSAFVPNSSKLHEVLSQCGIDTLMIAGTATNVCCESTARDAQMMDYRVFFIADCTATSNDELHNAALLNLQFYFAELVSKDDVLRRLAFLGKC